MMDFSDRAILGIIGIMGIVIGVALTYIALYPVSMTGALVSSPPTYGNIAVLVDDFCRNRGYDVGTFEGVELFGKNVLKITCTSAGPKYSAEMKYAVIDNSIYEWHQIW